MARAAKHVSIRPSQAEEGGGKFTIPAGSRCTITEIVWGTWADAGEGAIKGGRDPDDPALKIVVDVEDGEETTEFLGAGKKNRLEPSSDGEFLDPVDGSGATALVKGSNANIFLESVCDKKAHGKKAVPEDMLDDGISALTGLEFVAGRKKVERDIQDADEGGRGGKKGGGRPTLVAEEIIALPSKGGKGKTSRNTDDEDDRPARGRSSRGRDDDEDDKSARGKGGRDKGGDDDDVEAAAEKAVEEALALPKHRKGLSIDKAFSAVYSIVKGEDNAKEIGELIEDEKWLKSKDRPWTYDKDDDVLLAAD